MWELVVIDLQVPLQREFYLLCSGYPYRMDHELFIETARVAINHGMDHVSFSARKVMRAGLCLVARENARKRVRHLLFPSHFLAPFYDGSSRQ